MTQTLKPRKRNRSQRQIAPYLFILPFLLSFLAFFLVPVVYSVVISLMKYKGYGTMRYVGFDNYRRLLTYGAMWNSLLNTLQYFAARLISG